MALMFAPLKEHPVEDSPSSIVREPSVGLLGAYLKALEEMPKDKEGNVASSLFLGLRCLITLYDNGKLFLGSLMNYLHESDPETWQYSVSTEDSPRQILEAVPAEYLVRIVDYFADQIPQSQMVRLNNAIDVVWSKREDKEGND
jgi:hypothetical protein